MEKAIVFDQVSKEYRLGQISHGFFYRDLQSWIARKLGKKDPNSFSLIDNVDTKNDQSSNLYKALDKISLSIDKGEVVGIIGKNGAGKSTLLKILSKVTSPTSGRILINGKIASLLEVGTGFHPELTGRENVFLNGAILGMNRSEIASKFDEIVEFSGVGQFIDTPVKRYSSGMYVRLAFAVAAHLEPDILVIDEVLAVGDIEFQKKCLGKMNSISKNSGRTILFVSHNMAAIASLCSRAIYLKKGEIVFDGNAQEGINYYLNDNQSDMSQSLIDRLDRIGEGNIRFMEAWTEDASGTRRNLFLSGEDIVIVTKIKVKVSHQFKKITAAYAIKDNQDFQITDLNSTSVGTEFNNPMGEEYVIKCKVKEVPLTTGVYIFNAIIRTDNQIQDFLQNVSSFQIEEGDFYKTGKTIEKGQGVVLFKQDWELLDSKALEIS